MFCCFAVLLEYNPLDGMWKTLSNIQQNASKNNTALYLKLKHMDTEPYNFPKNLWSVHSLMGIRFFDFYMYLISAPGKYTKQYKSLNAWFDFEAVVY